MVELNSLALDSLVGQCGLNIPCLQGTDCQRTTRQLQTLVDKQVLCNFVRIMEM